MHYGVFRHRISPGQRSISRRCGCGRGADEADESGHLDKLASVEVFGALTAMLCEDGAGAQIGAGLTAGAGPVPGREEIADESEIVPEGGSVVRRFARGHLLGGQLEWK